MSHSNRDIPEAIVSFCQRSADFLQDIPDPGAGIEFVLQELPVLLLDRALMTRLMKNVVERKPYPDLLSPTMFDNEVVLYHDTHRLFSLRMYLWGPGQYVPPHDHNSWGVIGTVSNGFEVVNYKRLDDKTKESYAHLLEVERKSLQSAEMAYTLPLDNGIHETGNPTLDTIITLSIYGRSIPRGYIQGFDIVDRRVYRILPPRRKKEFLAAQALKTLGSIEIT